MASATDRSPSAGPARARRGGLRPPLSRHASPAQAGRPARSGRTVSGSRPTTDQPILRYPGRLWSFGVLKTRPTPSARQLLDRLHGEPREHAPAPGLGQRGGVDRPHRPSLRRPAPSRNRHRMNVRNPTTARRAPPPTRVTDRTGTDRASRRTAPRRAHRLASPSTFGPSHGLRPRRHPTRDGTHRHSRGWSGRRPHLIPSAERSDCGRP